MINEPTTLHILSNAPGKLDLNYFLLRCTVTDSIILTGDACYGIDRFNKALSEDTQLPRLFILSIDAEQRGVELKACNSLIECIDLEGLVNLSLNHQTVIHW